MNRVQRSRKLLGLAASLTFVLTACNHGDEPLIVEWDLTGQPTVDRTGWTPSTINTTELKPIEQVHLTFDNRTFEASQDIHAIYLFNDGEWLEELYVKHEPMTVEDAAQLMRSLDLGIPADEIDAWVKSTEGTEGQETPKFTAGADQTGFGNAHAWVKTIYGYADGRPVVVSVNFGWTKSLCQAELSDHGKWWHGELGNEC